MIVLALRDYRDHLVSEGKLLHDQVGCQVKQAPAFLAGHAESCTVAAGALPLDPASRQGLPDMAVPGAKARAVTSCTQHPSEEAHDL